MTKLWTHGRLAEDRRGSAIKKPLNPIAIVVALVAVLGVVAFLVSKAGGGREVHGYDEATPAQLEEMKRKYSTPPAPPGGRSQAN